MLFVWRVIASMLAAKIEGVGRRRSSHHWWFHLKKWSGGRNLNLARHSYMVKTNDNANTSKAKIKGSSSHKQSLVTASPSYPESYFHQTRSPNCDVVIMPSHRWQTCSTLANRTIYNLGTSNLRCPVTCYQLLEDIIINSYVSWHRAQAMDHLLCAT